MRLSSSLKLKARQPPPISTMLSRRHFINGTSATALTSATLMAKTDQTHPQSNPRPVTFPRFISTWKFGQAVNETALKTVQQGGSMLDAIEKGIWVAEADAQNASVGLGGWIQ